MNENLSLVTRTAEMPHDTHREHLTITRDWLQMFGAVALANVLIVALVGIAASIAAPLWLVLPLLTIFTFAAIAGMIVLRSLEYARYSLHTRHEEWRENQATGRKIAEIYALQYTSVNVKGKGNTVITNSPGQGQSAENFHLVSYRGPTAYLNSKPVNDLEFFIDQIPVRGYKKSAWMGVQLPSGQVVTHHKHWRALVEPLITAGIVTIENTASHIQTTDPAEIKRALRLDELGVVKEIAAPSTDDEPNQAPKRAPGWNEIVPGPDYDAEQWDTIR